jgi:hypothetical protein
MRGALVLVVLAACGGSAHPGRTAEPTCRELAVRGQALVEGAPAAEREEALRFVVEIVDLCQAPGLALRARSCLVVAPSIAAARSCPSLPTTGEDIGDPNRAEAPPCKDVVARAMRLADEAGEQLDTEERADLEQHYVDNCNSVVPEGRRCAYAATDVDLLDECLRDHQRADDTEHRD